MHGQDSTTILGGGLLTELLGTFVSSSSMLTLIRIAPGVQLVGSPVEGVSVLLVLKGAMRMEVAGEPACTLATGSLALVASGRAAKLSLEGSPVIKTVEGRKCLVAREGWLIADVDRGSDPALVVVAARIAGSGIAGAAAAVIAPISDDPVSGPIFAQLRAECERGANGSPAVAAALMNVFVVQGLRRLLAASPDIVAEPSACKLIARAVGVIRTHPADSHTIDGLASVAGMSRSSFTRHFKRAYRVAPSQFVQQVRLDGARTMLESTDLPIKAIATKSGFASRSHFTRVFRLAFEYDPSTYRARMRGSG